METAGAGETEILRVDEVARRLGVSQWTAAQWFREKKISAFKVGGRWAVAQGDLNDFIKRCREAGLKPEEEVSGLLINRK